MTKHISVIVGSLRRGSFARKIAQNVLPMFPEGYEARIVEIRDLPLYDFDYDDPEVTDKPVPAEYTAFRETITASAGVLFVTPENNRTIPACLKNAVDIGSKPNSDVAWKGLPVGIISHSVGRMGGYSSQKNLRLALSYFDMPTVGQPEVFLSQSPDLFEGGEEIVNGSTVGFLQSYIDRLSQVIQGNSRS
ncbi:chromate reductase [Pseudarthrobacter oxydans]|uniref:Chromate reductase n=1 Tax=Pseudarthrobacter oxydans TaxID=1671 RepID=A0AAW8NI23_PSEOX|nr:NADPH-dependent FMN reductase [Pseudarthrobacter oxydans]MBU3994384.1 NAD(P)H-dependent oxidoreductase [Actinomycetota bacterium]MDR7165752.1 chromate reductase [Pseudarthrobacter oxydans]